MGFICEGEERGRDGRAREDVGGLVDCVELTAVMSGRKQGFRNASLSPLCLII